MAINRRKSKKKGAPLIAVILVLAVIALGLWYLQQTGSKIEKNNQMTGTGDNINGMSLLNNMYVGKEVILTGDIKSSPDQVKYSYLLQLASNEQVGLVSTKTAIGNYNGSVSVKGTVKSYSDGMYVIDVSFITSDENANLTTDLSTAKTYIPDANIFVDVSDHPTPLDIAIQNGTITVADPASSMSGDQISISYFTCQKSDPLKDCQQIIASANAGDQFTNTQGMTFYKLAETDKWFSANENIGYMIAVPKDAFFYKVSSYINPIDSKYIQSRVSSQGTNYCYNTSSRLSTITKQTTTTKNNVWTTVIEGNDTDNKKVTCTLDMSFGEHQEKFTLASYIVSNENGDTTTTTTTDNGGDDTTTTPAPTNVGQVPGPTSTGYLFISNRGNYSVFFPSQKIAFEGINLDVDFGLDQTDCYANIQVKAYTDLDNDNVAPGVEIFECVTKKTVEEIKAELSQHIVMASKDETKVFIIKTNADSWKAFAEGIVIE